MCLSRKTPKSSPSSDVATEDPNPPNPPLQISHILQFGGASTPLVDSVGASTSTSAIAYSANAFHGPAGAAAILSVIDNEDTDRFSAVYAFREGLGNLTVSCAEYRGLLLGLRETSRRGYRNIAIQGNSELVVNQVLGTWQIGHQDLRILCNEVLELLRNSFDSYSIDYINENRSQAVDDQAILAITLPEGQVEVQRL